MKIIYNISIYLYEIVIRISSLFKVKSKLWINGRKDIFRQIKETIQNSSDIVWFHCASLGEFEQGKPIIKSYRLKYPTHKILLTFFSPSGFENKKETNIANWVFYLPIDTQANAKKFLDIVKPIKVIFIKNEFWFNYISELKKQKIPFYSVSSIFREEQSLLKYRWFIKQLKRVSHFFVQDKKSKEILNSLDIDSVTISGDTRFDSVIANAKNPINLPLIELFSKNKKTIICGSTWPKDEIILMKYIKNHTDNNYILIPHEIQHIAKLHTQTNGLLYSNANKKNVINTNVMIIDSIGILRYVYKYGNIAYIGGGFGSGIHNILEAVVFGLPVVFGPNYQKSNEAIHLIKKRGATSITNYNELKSAIDKLKHFDKSIAINYINNNSGATNKILKLID